VLLAALLALSGANHANAATIFESGTLGPTGVSWEDVFNQVVLAENVKSNAFNGVRFELTQPVRTTEVGGHFVAPPDTDTTFFAAIIALDSEFDFPDSEDLSTPDVLGATVLSILDTSAELSNNLDLVLNPGWYALVFGSGLFGANGNGGALLNNFDIGSPSYIGFLSGFGWGSRLSGKRYFVNGEIIPEPTSVGLMSFLCLLLFFRSLPFKICFNHTSNHQPSKHRF
jgi:hypothetical protein